MYLLLHQSLHHIWLHHLLLLSHWLLHHIRLLHHVLLTHIHLLWLHLLLLHGLLHHYLWLLLHHHLWLLLHFYNFNLDWLSHTYLILISSINLLLFELIAPHSFHLMLVIATTTYDNKWNNAKYTNTANHHSSSCLNKYLHIKTISCIVILVVTYMILIVPIVVVNWWIWSIRAHISFRAIWVFSAFIITSTVIKAFILHGGAILLFNITALETAFIWIADLLLHIRLLLGHQENGIYQ